MPDLPDQGHHRLVFQNYKEYLKEANASHSTVKNYLSDLRHFSGFIKDSRGSFHTDHINEESTLSYLKYLRSSHSTKPNIIKRKISSLSKFLKWAEEAGHTKDLYEKILPILKKEQGSWKPYSYLSFKEAQSKQEGISKPVSIPDSASIKIKPDSELPARTTKTLALEAKEQVLENEEEILEEREQLLDLREAEFETRKKVARLLSSKKFLLTSLAAFIAGFSLLVLGTTVAFLYYPESTAKFYNIDYANNTPEEVLSQRVLGNASPPNNPRNRGPVIGTILKPVASVSLEIIKHINSELYKKILPIENVNEIFALDNQGRIIPNNSLKLLNSSYLIIPDTGLIENLNADYIRGKVPGDGPGDLVVLDDDGNLAVVGNVEVTNNTTVNSISGGTATFKTINVSSIDLPINSVFSTNIVDGEVKTVDIADSSVTAAKIAPGVSFGGTGNITAVTAGVGLTGGGTTGSVTLNVGTGNGITINANDVAIRLDTTATDGATTSSVSGLEFAGTDLSLVRGCANDELLKWNNVAFNWYCAADVGAAGSSLQGAYDAGSIITTTNARDIDIVLADTAADSNFDIDIVAGSTSTMSISRLDGVDTAFPTQLLVLENLDITGTVANGLVVSSAAGGITYGIDVSDADIINAINIGPNAIAGTNFSVTGAGAITAVGVNSGSGLLQGTGGLTITGITHINTSGAAATNIGTGAYTGSVAIGNALANVSLTDTQWSISGTGVAAGLSGTNTGFTAGDLSCANCIGGPEIDESTLTIPFASVAGGTNTNALIIGAGGTLSTAGGGVITATDLVAGSSVVSDAEVDNDLTIDGTGSVNWAALTSYPAACAAGTAVTTLADSPTCTSFTQDGVAETITGGWTFNTLPTAFTTSIAANGGITSTAATLVINAAGNVDIQDALNADSLTSDAGVSIATGNAYTGTGAVTLSSGGAAGLTLDSASNTITIAANDTTLSRTAAGTFTLDLVDGANTVFAIDNSGAGAANLQVSGLDCTGNANGGALTADASGNISCSDDDSGGAAFSGEVDETTNDALTFTSDDASPPAGTVNAIFRDNTGDLNINTVTGKTLNIQIAGADEFNFSAAGLEFNSNNLTGVGNITGAGAITIASTGGGNDIIIDGADILDIQDVTTFAASATFNSGAVVATGALAVNSDSITSDGVTLVINAAGNVDIQDALNADSITSDAGVSIATGNAYTGAGTVTLSSAAASALTIDSGTVGALDIGTGANAKTITIGNATTTTTVNINSGTGGINLEAAGTGVTDVIQIGAGGAGSLTPDFFALDVKSDTGDPGGGAEGFMYYNTLDNKFRCFEGAAWTDCIGAGGGFSGEVDTTTNDALTFTSDDASPPAGTVNAIFRDNTGDLNINTVTGKTLNIQIAGADEFNFSAAGLEFNSNNLTGVGNITGAGAITIASTGGGNDIIIDGADILDVQDNATFAGTVGVTGLATFNTDVNMVFNETENLSLTNIVTGTNNLQMINVSLTNNSTGTVRGQQIVNNGGTGTTSALMILVNVDTDTNVTAGLRVYAQNAGTGGFVDAINIDSDAPVITNAINIASSNVVTDINLQFGETIDNDTDNVINFSGTADSTVIRLPVKTTTGDAGLDATEGNMYYNTFDNVFRCFENAAWTNCIGAGSSFSGEVDTTTNDALTFTSDDASPPAGTVNAIFRDNTGDLNINTVTGKTLNIQIAGADEFNFSAAGLEFNSNNLTGVGNITGAGAITIASSSNGNLTLSPNGTGDTVISGDADTNLQVTFIAAPTVDMTAITNASQGTSTDTVDGLSIDFTNAGAGIITNAGLHIQVTSNNTNASSFLYGIDIDDLTSGGEVSSEIALRIGTGWDTGISIESGGLTISGGSFTYTSGNRQDRKMVLSAEYPGASLFGDGTSNIGNLTSDYTNSTTGDRHTYYEWDSGEASLQDYTIVVRFTLPDDFGVWDATSAIVFDFITEDASSANNQIDISVFLESGASADATDLDNVSTSWTTTTIDDSILGECDAAGETCVIEISMQSQSNFFARIGDITLNYDADF